MKQRQIIRYVNYIHEVFFPIPATISTSSSNTSQNHAMKAAAMSPTTLHTNNSTPIFLASLVKSTILEELELAGAGGAGGAGEGAVVKVVPGA